MNYPNSTKQQVNHIRSDTFAIVLGFSEQIIIGSELTTLGLNEKTIIGIKYTFKNSLSDSSTYTLANQSLSIHYTSEEYYGAPSPPYQEIPTERTNEQELLNDHIFSLVLDNIDNGAVPLDTTAQDFFIYFTQSKQFVLDTTKILLYYGKISQQSRSFLQQ